jgi:type II secretory pathway pseudopilin PulG
MKPDEGGESLIELIVAMAILGGAMLTIVASFLSLSKISGVERDQSKAFTALTAASEYAKNRSCARPGSGACAAESNVPSSTVPHDADTTINISARSTISLNGGTTLNQYIVTVVTGTTTYTNVVVIR